MHVQIQINDFERALLRLDELLEGPRSQGEELAHMCIKAIGGFALLFHSVRTSGYTADIDSVTEDYPELVIKCIEQVAAEYGFNNDWVNNYNVLDNDTESIEMMLNPFWQKAEYGLKNIDIWIADLETLLRAKLIAAEDDDKTGRVQDFPDLIDIFHKLGCTSAGDCLDYCTDIDIELFQDYPRNYRRLLGAFMDKALMAATF